MPIACNPRLEANQSKGKISVQQSQALACLLSVGSPLGTRCLSLILFSLLCSPVCLWALYVSQLQSSDEAQPQPWGAAEEGNPQDKWSGHGQLRTQQPSLFCLLLPWQTFALQLSFNASQKLTPTLLSGNANHSLRTLEMEKKEGREGTQ